MTGEFRVEGYGRVDRHRQVDVVFDGRTFSACTGDTLASALLAHGEHHVATSVRLGRPRGITTAGSEEPTAIVQVEQPFPEPMLTATTVEACPGLVARSVAGQGRLAAEPDPARYDTRHAHADVLIVGAGPAGLAAALTAGRAGARVVLVDDQPAPGGALLGTPDLLDRRPGADWATAAVAELSAMPDVRILMRTSAFGYYDDNLVLALERRTDHLGSAAPDAATRQRVWRIRARQVLLATGGHERGVVFPDNDRPGIMLAGAARTYLHRYGVAVGRRVALFTTNDTAYGAAFDLARAGVHVVAVLDSRADVAARLRAACADLDLAVHTAVAVRGTGGAERIDAVDTTAGRFACDALLVSGGWQPATQLFSHAGGRSAYDAVLGAFVPQPGLTGVQVAGAAAGIADLAACLRSGGETAGQALGVQSVRLPQTEPTPEPAPSQTLWRCANDDPQAQQREFVDLQRDATTADVLRAVGAGMRSVEHVKRYTTIGTAHDQGRTSGLIASGIVADALGLEVGSVGTTTSRPPVAPVSFAALAGRNVAALHDPERVTAVHQWHVEHGAVFENVGQWKRPWAYPRDGEDLDDAVLRECRAARESVAMMDGSTLGKIDVQGADAAELLDRLYTNLISTLKVGAVRYALMCTPDGMVFDDGTVARIAPDRFLVTTTTGNAAAVLEWMEEWLQTEWPDLRVRLTSVTEHWVTLPLVGPRSRDVLGAVAPALDVANEAFPFMTWRDAVVGGIPARVCRISFSGELAYELNVRAWYGLALWEQLMAAGRPFGITPYGTEAMHVLRAEKGYPIVGQDTDGTVSPHDLGMSWAVSKKKPDFVGKRSFARPANLRADRKQLVGLLPVDPHQFVPEGAQLIEADAVLRPPVPMLGHVTSSYRSAALGRTFALGLLRGGHARHGETVHAWHDGESVPVTVTGSVLFDAEGLRRDG